MALSLPECLILISWRCCILLLGLLGLLHASWHCLWFFILLHGFLLLEVFPQPIRGPTSNSEHAGLQPLWARGSNNCEETCLHDSSFSIEYALHLCFCSALSSTLNRLSFFRCVSTRCPSNGSPPMLLLSYPCYCGSTGCSLQDLMFFCLYPFLWDHWGQGLYSLCSATLKTLVQASVLNTH